MRIIVIALVAAMLSVSVHAAEGVAPLSVGQKQFNIGLGGSDGGIPIHLSLDFCVHRDITVAPVARVYIDDGIGVSAGAKGDYHFNRIIGIPQNFDFYAGLNVGVGGMYIGDYYDPTPQNPNNRSTGMHSDINIDLGLQIGGRWYWSEVWGLNLELGGGNNNMSGIIGLSYKL